MKPTLGDIWSGALVDPGNIAAIHAKSFATPTEKSDVIKKGRKTAAGHFGKAVKGKFIRFLAQNNIKSIDQFDKFEYDGFKWNGEQFIKEIKE